MHNTGIIPTIVENIHDGSFYVLIWLNHWVTSYLVKHYLDVSVRMFVDEMNIEISTLFIDRLIKPVTLKVQFWIFIRCWLKLKLQYLGHLIQKADSLEKTLMLGKTEGKRKRRQQRKRWQMASPTQWTWIWANSGRYWTTEEPGVLQSMGSQRVRHNLATKQQQNIHYII